MNIVAVTSCPTGIAHSQMAAENIKTTAEARGHTIDVEVQGAMGTQDELSAEAIANADVVVITADTAVSTDRFEGLPVVKKTVKDGVNKAEAVIREAEALAGESEEDADVDAADEDELSESEVAEAETAPAEEEADELSEGEQAEEKSGGLLSSLKKLFS